MLMDKVCMIEDIIRWRAAPAKHQENSQDINSHNLDRKLEIDQAQHARVSK